MSISLDNTGIVVADLDAMVAFFTDLGLHVDGTADIEGEWADSVLGLEGVRSRIAVVATPDGHGRLELVQYEQPPAVGGEEAPVTALGLRRLSFTVDDIDAVVTRLTDQGYPLIGEVTRYEDVCRLAYVRGPEGLILMVTEFLDEPGGTQET